MTRCLASLLGSQKVRWVSCLTPSSGYGDILTVRNDASQIAWDVRRLHNDPITAYIARGLWDADGPLARLIAVYWCLTSQLMAGGMLIGILLSCLLPVLCRVLVAPITCYLCFL